MSFKLNNIEQAIKIKKTFSAIESMAEYAKRDDSLINAVNTDLFTAFDEFKFTFVERVRRIANYFKHIDCLAEELESQLKHYRELSEKASDDEKFCYENSERKTVFDRQAYKAELAIMTLIYKEFSNIKDACDLTEEFEKTFERKLSHLIAVDNVFSDNEHEDEYANNALRRSYSR